MFEIHFIKNYYLFHTLKTNMSLDFKFAIPDVLNYANSKPNDIGSYSEIAVVTPATGSGPVTLGDYFTLNIPKCGSDSVLDAQSSFLRFKINNNITTAGGTASLCESCDCIISRLEVMHNNNIIETIDNYDLLSSIFLDTQVNARDRCQSLNITKGCYATAGDMTGLTIDKDVKHYYLTTLISGVVGSLAHAYIPLFA